MMPSIFMTIILNRSTQTIHKDIKTYLNIQQKIKTTKIKFSILTFNILDKISNRFYLY